MEIELRHIPNYETSWFCSFDAHFFRKAIENYTPDKHKNSQAPFVIQFHQYYN